MSSILSEIQTLERIWMSFQDLMAPIQNAKYHITTVLSPHPVMAVFPSRKISTQFTQSECPSRTASCSCVFRSQAQTVSSSDMETNRCPSGILSHKVVVTFDPCPNLQPSRRVPNHHRSIPSSRDHARSIRRHAHRVHCTFVSAAERNC